jgi:hypothetical protein
MLAFYLDGRNEIMMISKLIRSNFSYLFAIVLFLFILISLQKGLAQQTQEAQPPQNQPAPQAVKPLNIEEPAVTMDATKTETNKPQNTTTVATPPVPPPEPQQIDPTQKAEDPSAPVVSDEKISHEVIRRIVVFPLATDGEFKKEADLAWWKVREFLSEQQRFLVATKRYMQQNEVFQPRKNLLISDVILLAKLLESDCLITTYLENKKLHMNAYSGQDGLLLWKKTIDITASKPVSQQLEELSAKLIQDFYASIPYQGFQIVDPLNQEPLIEEGTSIMARVDVGAGSSAIPGQKAQWLEIDRASPLPLFQGGAKIRIIAEGEVIKNDNQVLTLEVKRVKSLKLLDKKSIITIPDERKRIADLYALKNSKEIQPNLTMLSEPMTDAREKSEEARPLLTALTAIANIVVAVLLF